MIDVGDKVVVTDVPEGFGLEGIEVGSVGEVAKRVDKTCVDILFEDGKRFLGFDDEREYLESKNYGHTHVFLVEKFDNKEEKKVMLEVGDKVVVTKVVENILEGIEVGKVGEIIKADYCDSKRPYKVNFGDCKWWAGEEFLVEKLEDVETGETLPEEEIKGAEVRQSVNVKEDNVGEALTVEEAIKSYIEENKCSIKPKEVPTTDNEDTFKVEERQAAKEIDNPTLEGAYNTVIEKDGLTIYTNYSVEVVGEAMRVGGVDDLASDFDDSEDGGGELGE